MDVVRWVGFDMENIDKLYSDFHAKRYGIHCYPNEFLVRTLLGNYPDLKLEHNYEGSKILDWACGDGRNLVLLNNLSKNIYGFEITQEICDGVKNRMNNMGINPEIRVGRNNNVPYEDDMFDYVVASSSIYYVDHNSSFEENLAELVRVLRGGGYAIVTLCHPDSFIVKNSKLISDGHYEITSDPYGLRNGDIFKIFHNKEEIIKTFSKDFTDICIGMQNEDYYGMHIQLWLVVMKKKKQENF